MIIFMIMPPVASVSRVLLFAALSLMLAWPATAQEPVRRPDSFRGILFGESLENTPDLVRIQQPGYTEAFHKPNEMLTFGQANILSVAYYFHHDRFTGVGIAYQGEVNHFLIKDMLINAYGPGRQVGFSYGWTWPDFSLVVTYDPHKDQGEVRYTLERLPPEQAASP